jgi:hypothetical protein
MISPAERPTFAALTTLIILQLVMLSALFTQSTPHPPDAIILFAIAPYLSVSLSAAASAIIFGPSSTTPGRILSICAALLALLSFGPQKYFDPQLPLIWPAIITAQIAAAVIFLQVFRRK